MATSPAGKRRETVYVKGAQEHTSPIPQGVKAGGFLFLSALRGVNPATQKVETEDPEQQSRQLLENLKRTLAAVGATLEDVVKVSVFMLDLQGDRPAFNKVWAEYFPKDPPARFAVQVADLGPANDKSRILLEVMALAP